MSLIYSPQHRRYDVSGLPESMVLTAPHAAVDASPRIGWHGKPESSFGGMYRSSGAEIARPSYSSEPGCRALGGLPIAAWTTKSLEAEWKSQVKDLVDNELESPGPSRLAGTLRHHFPEPIEDWVVAYGHQVFWPRNDPRTGRPLPLVPDVPWSPRTASQRELAGYLTGAKKVSVKSETTQLEEDRIEHAEYDPLDRDPMTILRMLTFHREAGGTLYTGLDNGAMRKDDWTPLLELDRAVLVGRIRRPAINWTIDGKPVAPEVGVTLIRLLLPVRHLREE